MDAAEKRTVREAQVDPDTADAGTPSPEDDGAAVPLHRNREYVTWFAGTLLASAGAGIGAFAIPLVVVVVTGSAASAGIVGMASGLGLLVMMVPGGLLADRAERRRLRLWMGVSGIAIHAVLAMMLLSGHATLLGMAALATLDGARTGLLGAGGIGMLRSIVAPSQLPQALAVNQARSAAIEIGSPPLGGLLLGIGAAVPALAEAIGNAGVVVSTLLMRGSYAPRREDAVPSRLRDDVGEALRWCWGQAIRMRLLLVSSLTNLGSNGLLMTVVLALAAQGMPPAQIGLLSSVLAVAMLAGALLAPRLVDAVPTGLLIVVPICLIATAGVLLPFLTAWWVIAATYAVLGFGIAPLNAAVQGFFVLVTPDRLQGRMGALSSTVAMVLMPVAPVVAGVGLDHLGKVPTMGIFAAVCIVAALVAATGRDLRSIPVASRWEAFARRNGLLP